MGNKVGGGGFFRALASVQNDLNFYAAFVRVNQSLRNRRTGERIRLYQDVVGGMVERLDNGFGATYPSDKAHLSVCSFQLLPVQKG
jgi:hypothetical protein